jgi:peptide/nickel transport system permease protein
MSDLSLIAQSRARRRLRDRRALDVWRRALSFGTGKVGLVLLSLLVALAIFGPLFAPHGISEIAGPPAMGPSAAYPMGTDQLGRDVFSRFLNGGRSVIAIAVVATLLGYALGIMFGLASGYLRGRFDRVTIFFVDVFLSFPPIILVLILLSGTGARVPLLVFGVALVHLPRVTRVVRAATLEIGTRGFVERAEARGEKTSVILLREILPNVWTPVLVDFGIRLSASVILVASLSFLGFGLQPPAADWALMISENLTSIFAQPWAVLWPAVALGLLTIAVNMLGDSISRAVGRSLEQTERYT